MASNKIKYNRKLKKGIILEKYNWQFINQEQLVDLFPKYENWQNNIYYDTWIYNSLDTT